MIRLEASDSNLIAIMIESDFLHSIIDKMDPSQKKKRNYRQLNDKEEEPTSGLERQLDEMISQLGLPNQDQAMQVSAMREEVLRGAVQSVEPKVEAFLSSDAYWDKLQLLLKEKRSQLEDQMIEKLNVVRVIHLEKRRREMEGARKQHQELENTIEELDKKTQMAKKRIQELTGP